MDDAVWSTSLERDAGALDGYRAVFRRLADTIAASWEPAMEGDDPESLHHLRVALRKTRAVLAGADGVMPGDVRDAHRGEFRWLAGATGVPRDLDVTVIGWEGDADGLPPRAAAALAPVLDDLRGRRRSAHAELCEAMRSDRADKLLTSWHEWLAESCPRVSADECVDAHRPLADVVAGRVERAHRRLVKAGRAISPTSDAAELHELRKDAKKLRYTVDSFSDILAKGPQGRFVKALKGLQENLGEHQDAAVHTALLEDVIDRLGSSVERATLVAVGRMLQVQTERQQRARAEFAHRFAAFDRGSTRRAVAKLSG